MSQNLINRRIWCNTDSRWDKQYRLNQPRSILVLSLSVGIWLPESDLCPLSLACMRPLIISSLCFPLLRWAQFFICPLMIRDAIDREVEAVDSGESWCLKCSPFCIWSTSFHPLYSRVLLSQLFTHITVFLCRLNMFCFSPSPCQSTSWLSRQTPTGRRCCSAVWPNLDTLWANSAGVSW